MCSQEDKNTLIEKILECGIDDEKKHKEVLNKFDSIASDIRSRISYANNPRSLATSIVDICLDRDDGIEKFTYAIFLVDGASRSWKALDEFVQTFISKSIVSYTELKKVWVKARTIKGLEGIQIDAYVASVPENWKPPKFNEESDVLIEMLKDTAKVGILPERVPLLEFVERLALYASEQYPNDQKQQAVSKQLRDWIQFTGVALKLNPNQRESVSSRTRQKKSPLRDTPKAPYLLIDIYEDSSNSMLNTDVNREYNFKAFILDEEYKPLKDFPATNIEGQATKDLEASIGKLINESFKDSAWRDLNNSANLTIEFLVPDELLGLDFECWKVITDDGPIELGSTFRVVVRSAKRLRSAQRFLYESSLNNKWKEFLKLKKQSISKSITCVCGTEDICILKDIGSKSSSSHNAIFCCQKEYNAHIGLEKSLKGTSIICLVLAHAPHCIIGTSGSQRTLFQKLRLTGIPIALWAREGLDTELLVSSLSDFSFSSLPEEVRQWRYDHQNADEKEEEQTIRKGLTLLWDDPTHLPPDMQYVVPVPSK